MLVVLSKVTESKFFSLYLFGKKKGVLQIPFEFKRITLVSSKFLWGYILLDYKS